MSKAARIGIRFGIRCAAIEPVAPVAGRRMSSQGGGQEMYIQARCGQEKEKARGREVDPRAFRGDLYRSGDTYSRAFGTTIGSESLTTVFGMGTGVAFPIWSPERSRLVR